MGLYTLQHLATLDDLENLRPEWSELWRHDPRATPFQAPAWLLPWARRFAPDRCHAFALRRQDRLVSLLPFFSWRGQLFLAGTGHIDYGDVLDADESADAGTLLLAALADAAREYGCEQVDLQQLRADSPLLSAATPADWHCETTSGDTCTAVMLGGADGLAATSAHHRKKLAYAARSLRRVAAHALRPIGADEVPSALTRLAELHARRWGERDESGMLADATTRAFLDAALCELAGAGILRLHVLEADGTMIAGLVGMRAGDTMFLYLCAFDPAWSRYSPGALALAQALGAAAREGMRRCDFLRGAEAYKYRFGAKDLPTYRRRLWRK